MIHKLLNTQTKSVTLASLILASFYVASACLGLLRERLLAGQFGARNELDVYYAAFTIPDFIALLLVFGAISAAIIPIFSQYLVGSKEEAWRYTNALLNTFLGFLIVVCLFFMVFAPFFVTLVAPGFPPEKQAMTATLMRIMFLSPILLGLSNIVSGILQVFHRFLVTAMAPLMYNLGIIIGILVFVPRFGFVGLAWGVVLGGVLHLLIQLPAFFHSGFRYRPAFDWRHPGVIKTMKMMVPRSLGLGAGQFNTMVTTSIASTLVVGSVAVFNLAGNLSSLCVNAIAISLSTAIFPAMSLAHLKDDKYGFNRKFSRALRQILFLLIPLSLFVFILRAQIVRVILGTGRFGWTDTRLTAACLGIFAIGLCGQGLIFLLSKTFYALHNTKIPAIASVVTVVCNIALSFLLVWMLRTQTGFSYALGNLLRLEDIPNISVVGLPMAFAATMLLEAMLLLFFLYKYYKTFRVRAEVASFAKQLLAGCALLLATFTVRHVIVEYEIIHLQTFLEVFFQLVVSVTAGGLAYLLAAWLLQSDELEAIRLFIKNRR